MTDRAVRAFAMLFFALFTALVGAGLVYATYVAKRQFFPEKWVSITYTSWVRASDGHLEMRLVTILNKHDSKLKDFTVSCDAIGKSGTVIETVKTTLYESLGPRQHIQFPTLDFGQISEQTFALGCRVTGCSTSFR